MEGDPHVLVSGGRHVGGLGGTDTVVPGAGDDKAFSDPGDGNDAIDGQDGVDFLETYGSDANERFAVSPDGDRVRVVHDVSGETKVARGIEEMEINPDDGADQITLDEPIGTAVTRFRAPTTS